VAGAGGIVEGLSEGDALRLVSGVVDVDLLDAVRGVVDLRVLASLILWVEGTLGYRVSDIGILEASGARLVELRVSGCGWREWKLLSRAVKQHLIEEGYGDVAGKVILVCDQATE
jgi:hypothetical protein